MTTTDNVVMAETQAIRLLREGYSPAQIFDKTGVTKDRLSVLANSFGGQRAPAVQPRPPLLPARPLTSLAAPRERDVLAELMTPCQGHALLFDDPAAIDAARGICKRQCAQLIECRAWALRTEVAGVCGGLTEQERALWREAFNVKPAQSESVEKTESRLRAATILQLLHGESLRDVGVRLGLNVQTVARIRDQVLSTGTYPQANRKATRVRSNSSMSTPREMEVAG